MEFLAQYDEQEGKNKNILYHTKLVSRGQVHSFLFAERTMLTTQEQITAVKPNDIAIRE